MAFFLFAHGLNPFMPFLIAETFLFAHGLNPFMPPLIMGVSAIKKGNNGSRKRYPWANIYQKIPMP